MTKKKYIVLEIIALLFFAATVVTDMLYMTLGNAYTFKTIASCTFVLCAVVNFALIFAFRAVTNKMFMIFMLIGQVFACLGDIVLIEFFEIGAILFAVGHVFYFVAYCFLKKFKLTDFIYIGAAIAVSMVIIFASKIELGSMAFLIIAYALIISCMLGKSATLIKWNTMLGIFLFVGSLMFYLSDLFLMFNIFGNIGRVGSVLCLGFYYPAEFLLAESIVVCNIFRKSKTEETVQN